MKRLNLVNVNFNQGNGAWGDNYYLPYSTGALWSYASSFDEIKRNWQLGHLSFKREPIEEIYKKLADADIIGFSTYVWNKNYNYQLAKAIKSYNPGCRIILGGPEPALDKDDIFNTIPFVDAIVRLEGEQTLVDILRTDNTKDLVNVKGLIINDAGSRYDTGPRQRLELVDIPSPYLTGVFDEIIAQNPYYKWGATLETNRGCPYQCTFCDWGSLTYSKVKKFDLDKVLAEIEWIGRNKIDYIYIADANFGIFSERDNIIVDKIIETREKYNGYPLGLSQTWAKDQNKNIIDIIKKLRKGKDKIWLSISVQSMDDNVLGNIKRRNLAINKAEEIFKMCSAADIFVKTELILGLPGETLKSWRQNFYDLLKNGQHNGMIVYLAQLLENSEMNIKQRHEFDFETMWIDTQYGSTSNQDKNDNIIEEVEVVIGTKDMPHADWRYAYEFWWFIYTWHVSGISQWYSRYLSKAHDISYADFYEGLESYLSKTWYDQERDIYRSLLDRLIKSNHKDKNDLLLKTMSLPIINTAGRANIAIKGNINQYHEAIEDYVRNRYGELISKELFEDMISLSRAAIIDWKDFNNYPKELSFKHDIIGYLNLDKELTNPVKYVFSNDFTVSSLEEFIELLYYKKNKEFGKASIKVLRQ